MPTMTKRKNCAGDAGNELDDLQAMLAEQGYADDQTLNPGASLIRQAEALVAQRQESRRLAAEVEQFRALQAELPDLRLLAALGRQYRSELLDEAITAGNDAQGAGFDEPAYRALLTDASIEQIKTIRDDFRRSTAARTFTAGHAVPRRPVA